MNELQKTFIQISARLFESMGKTGVADSVVIEVAKGLEKTFSDLELEIVSEEK
jgi:hypothetical protein